MNEYTDEDDATKTIVKYHKKLLDAWEVMKEEKADEELNKLFEKAEKGKK